MARDTMYRRYDNNKIQLQYLTLDSQILDVMASVIEDRAIIGEIICAFNAYERGGANEIPTLEDKTAQAYLKALIEKHELCRDKLQAKSDRMKETSNQRNKPAKDLD